MKAWEIRQGKLRLHELQPARPPSGHANVTVTHAGLCGSDLPKLLRPGDFALPPAWRPGHEIVGLDITGRPVAVDPLVPCQRCPSCAEGDIHLCAHLQRLGWDLPGGLAEQVLAPQSNIHPLPRGLAPLHAVLADPAAVAIHGLRCNPIPTTRRLAVIGAGTIGLLTAIYAIQAGWNVTIIHKNSRPPSSALSRAIPADFHPISAAPRVGRYDTVVDAASGSEPAPLELALRLVTDGGTVIVQNAYHPNVRLRTALRDIFRRSIRLVGSFSYCRAGSPDDFHTSLMFLRDHSQQISQLVYKAGKLVALPTILAKDLRSPARQVLTVNV